MGRGPKEYLVLQTMFYSLHAYSIYYFNIYLYILNRANYFFEKEVMVASSILHGEGNGTPLQYSCLETPMDGGAWWAVVHGVSKVGHDFTFTFLHWRRKWQPTPVFLPGESQGRGAWWASVYGVAQSRTRLKRLGSSSSSSSNKIPYLNFLCFSPLASVPSQGSPSPCCLDLLVVLYFPSFSSSVLLSKLLACQLQWPYLP